MNYIKTKLLWPFFAFNQILSSIQRSARQPLTTSSVMLRAATLFQLSDGITQ